MSSTVQHLPATAPAWTPVTQEQVHKLTASEVLLTEWCQLDDDVFTVLANWPHEHSFYGPQHGLHDPMLLVESVRQCIPLLSHVVYGAPVGHRQSWSRFSFELAPTAPGTAPGPTAVELRITCKDVIRRMGRLASLQMRVDVLRDGVRIGTAQTGFANHAPAVYRRLRGAYGDLGEAVARALPLPPPTTPSHVAREDFADVVLSPTDSPRRNQMRVDLNHPVLFDHPVDHAPGMLLLEAARQASHTAVHQPAAAVAMDGVFARYAELDAPCWIHTDPFPTDRPDHHRVLVTAVQNDICVFSSITTLVSLPLG
ncbi:ScbA/BarX family gamma-butyrolactone biosynthesis protein [Streptomyces sp. NPDC006739]|uniref:ScbA/BarX family gamma-butyrolactone biosynthesis protein n=1 Tax=Streptomyces sp. NPDC006739 TaxID=3364763 RepID=UPI00369C1392